MDLLHGNFYLLNSLIYPPLTSFSKTVCDSAEKHSDQEMLEV